jgi:hypothetical protein
MQATFEIAELIGIFRASLIALIPLAERARIPWQGPEVYDPWETIERALFEAIVESVVENARPSPPCALPKYGIAHRSYADLSFITDRAARLRGERLAFIELTTIQDPFDTMCFLDLGADFIPTGRNVELSVLQVTPELAARTASSLSYRDVIEYDE